MVQHKLPKLFLQSVDEAVSSTSRCSEWVHPPAVRVDGLHFQIKLRAVLQLQWLSDPHLMMMKMESPGLFNIQSAKFSSTAAQKCPLVSSLLHKTFSSFCGLQRKHRWNDMPVQWGHCRSHGCDLGHAESAVHILVCFNVIQVLLWILTHAENIKT